MKPRLLFLAIICVLLSGWYQMRILPYGTGAEHHGTEPLTERQRAMFVRDSSFHAMEQALPIPSVW